MKTAFRQSGVVNLKDVAKRAGCSIATASRVLNGHPTVGAAERERVLEAASQLRYVANSAARALRSQETRLVGLIVPTLDHAIYARMVDGLQLQLEKAGISVLINSSGYDLEREETQARILVARGVEAVVMVGAEHRPATADYLSRAGVHQIFTYTTELGNGDAAIGFDNREAAAVAGRFLLDMGHRRFGMISGISEGNDRARYRRKGFQETLAAAGVPESEIVVIETSYNIELGGAAMRSLMQTRPPPDRGVLRKRHSCSRGGSDVQVRRDSDPGRGLGRRFRRSRNRAGRLAGTDDAERSGQVHGGSGRGRDPGAL